MPKKLALQSQDVDVSKAIENVGGNRFQLVLVASARAREIANKRNLVLRNDPTVEYSVRVNTEALNDIAEGRVSSDIVLKHT